MNPQDYKKARQLRGTQKEVAARLGVRQATISDRETGKVEITHEAALALVSLTIRPPQNEGMCIRCAKPYDFCNCKVFAP